MNFRKYLTPEERLFHLRRGGTIKLAECIDDPVLIKQALNLPFDPGKLSMAIIYTSLLLGVPIGVARHKFGQDIKRKRVKEEQYKEEADLYANALRDLHLPEDKF